MAYLVLIVLGLLGFASWYFSVAAMVILGGAMAFLVSAFTFGTFWFWLILLAMSLFVSWCVTDDFDKTDDDMWSGTALLTLVVFGLIMFFANRNMIDLSAYSGLMRLVIVLGAFAAYLTAGAGWSALRYKFIFLKKRMGGIERWKQESLATLRSHYGFTDEASVAAVYKQGEPDMPPGHRRDGLNDEGWARLKKFESAKRYYLDLGALYYSLTPGSNISRLMAWIGLWPWSVISWVLRDPVQFVYDLMIGAYNRIYESVVGDAKKEFDRAFSSGSDSGK